MSNKSGIANQEKDGLHRIDPERVAELAHELFLARGAGDGRDREDWLEAERILQEQIRSHGKRALL